MVKMTPGDISILNFGDGIVMKSLVSFFIMVVLSQQVRKL